jgi:hypothetical protein
MSLALARFTKSLALFFHEVQWSSNSTRNALAAFLGLLDGLEVKFVDSWIMADI